MATAGNNVTTNGVLKWVVGLATPLVAAAIVSMATFTYNTSQSNVQIAIEMKFMRIQLDDMKRQLDDLNNNYVTKTQFFDHEQRIRRLEQPAYSIPTRGGR